MKDFRKLWMHFMDMFQFKVVFWFSVLWAILAYFVFDLYLEDTYAPHFISSSEFLLLILPCFFYVDSKLLKNENDTAELYYNIRLKKSTFVMKPAIMLCFSANIFLFPCFLVSCLVIILQGIAVPGYIIMYSFLAKMFFLITVGLFVRIVETFFPYISMIYIAAYVFCVADYILGYSRRSLGGASFLLKYVCSLFIHVQSWKYILGTFAVMFFLQIYMQTRYKEYWGVR